MNERDRLTGVYTREAFCIHAEELIRNHPEMQFDIVMSDVVNFKYYNERYGTEAGDLLLIRTGEMLSGSVPDVVCGRYGADRFVSVTPHLNEAALGFLENFQLPEKAKEELPSINLTVKFGICPCIDIKTPISVSCDRAYLAVQSVKHQYEQRIGIYNEQLGEQIRQQLLIEENMKSAIETDQFVVYYQPKLDLNTGKICGAEALTRWQHPVYGFMNPGIFIPMFENNGFITTLDLYICDRVCRDLSEGMKKGIPVVPVSVNISRKDFSHDNLSDEILRITDHYGLNHELLHLEVTESACAKTPEKVEKHVIRLHEAGFVIELDDFGAGYTSLSSLLDTPIDILKLDMTLLKKDRPGRSVLEFAMKLAGMMGLRTIQEGVETAEQLERCRSLGCNVIQGFYYSRPLSRVSYEAFLIAENADT